MYDKTLSPPVPAEDIPDTSQNSYYAYLEEISRYKLLTAEEEAALFLRIQNGDTVARDLFIKSNLRLVVHEARKYYIPGFNQQLDLIQDGNLGLLKAVERYDPLRGCRFSTYAVYHINKAIQRSSCRTGLPLTLPQQKLSLINKLRFTAERLEVENGTKPSLESLSEHLNVSLNQIREVLPFLGPVVSLQSKINDDVDDREVIDVFDEHYKNERDAVENKCIIDEMRIELCNIISDVLEEKAAYILISRWGLSGQPVKDVPTLAHELNMTYQGIRQSEARSIIKLKRHLLSINKSLQDFI